MDRPWRLEIFDEVESTSDLVIGRADKHEPEGLAIMGRLQTKGRGSRGRTWVAPVGNLNLSVLFRPIGPVNASLWGLMAAVAFHDALLEAAPGAELSLKWPNDIMLGGRKLAGLLIETAQDGQGGCRWLVAGLGANLQHTPPGLERPLACLADATSAPPTPDDVADFVLGQLFRWRFASGSDIRAAWLARAHPLGTALSVSGVNTHGYFAGLDADGALLLMVDGMVQRFSSGDLVFAAEHHTRA